MASWKENMSRMAQSAVAKSKEMAEITRLNMEISNLEQKLRENYSKLGEYIIDNPALLAGGDDAVVVQICQAVAEIREKLEQDRQQILDIRNVNVCTNCGAEVSRASKFCDRCGTVMDRSALQQSARPVCPECGAEIDDEAAFCGNCGAKLKN